MKRKTERRKQQRDGERRKNERMKQRSAGWEGVVNRWLLEDVHESDVDAEF